MGKKLPPDESTARGDPEREPSYEETLRQVKHGRSQPTPAGLSFKAYLRWIRGRSTEEAEPDAPPVDPLGIGPPPSTEDEALVRVYLDPNAAPPENEADLPPIGTFARALRHFAPPGKPLAPLPLPRTRPEPESAWRWTNHKAQMFALAVAAFFSLVPLAGPALRCFGAAASLGILVWLSLDVPPWTRKWSSTIKRVYVGVSAVAIVLFFVWMWGELNPSPVTAYAPQYEGTLSPETPTTAETRGEFSFGGDLFYTSLLQQRTVEVSYYGKTFLTVGFDDKGSPWVDTTVADEHGNYEVIVHGLEYKISRERTFNPIQRDGKSLLIRDLQNNRVFDLQYEGPRRIHVKGHFQVVRPNKQPAVLIVNDYGFWLPSHRFRPGGDVIGDIVTGRPTLSIDVRDDNIGIR